MSNLLCLNRYPFALLITDDGSFKIKSAPVLCGELDVRLSLLNLPEASR